MVTPYTVGEVPVTIGISAIYGMTTSLRSMYIPGSIRVMCNLYDKILLINISFL
jgi:hypothetical protein